MSLTMINYIATPKRCVIIKDFLTKMQKALFLKDEYLLRANRIHKMACIRDGRRVPGKDDRACPRI